MSMRDSIWWYRHLSIAFGGCVWLGLIVWFVLGMGDLGSLHYVFVGMITIMTGVLAGILAVLVELLKRCLPIRPVIIVGVLILAALTTHGALMGRQMARFERHIISPPPQSLRDLETWRTWAFMFQHEDYYLFTVDDEGFLSIRDHLRLEDVTTKPWTDGPPEDPRLRLFSDIGGIDGYFADMLEPDTAYEDLRVFRRDKWVVVLRNGRTGRTLIRYGYMPP